MAMHPNTRAALNSPETRAKRAAAAKRSWEDPETRAKRAAAGAHVSDIQCPKWVPGDLISEFFEIAAFGGEMAACAHIRRLKRSMEAV